MVFCNPLELLLSKVSLRLKNSIGARRIRQYRVNRIPLRIENIKLTPNQTFDDKNFLISPTMNRSFQSGIYYNEELNRKKKETLIYAISAIITIGGLVYAAVPLYRIFCQETGLAGTPITSLGSHGKIRSSSEAPLIPVKGARPVQITFAADTAPNLPWEFVPEQRHVKVIPGQTALAFFSATNKGSCDITGVATYTIIPARAAQYFNKIQCFCFEEQRLNAGEQVEMPVFFYLDPEFAYDPMMDSIEDIILGYSFFMSK